MQSMIEIRQNSWCWYTAYSLKKAWRLHRTWPGRHVSGVYQ